MCDVGAGVPKREGHFCGLYLGMLSFARGRYSPPYCGHCLPVPLQVVLDVKIASFAISSVDLTLVEGATS